MTHWFPENVSTYGGRVDGVIQLVFWIVGIWFVVVLGLLLYFAVRYRRARHPQAAYVPARSWRAMAFVLVPCAVVLGLDLVIEMASSRAWDHIKVDMPPADLTLRVIGKQYVWMIVHPGPDGVLGTADDGGALDFYSIDPAKRYLFYLHGKIIEEQGLPAVSPDFGEYQYEAILQKVEGHGFEVISEQRPKGANGEEYARSVAEQVKTLIDSGVPPPNITVVGASKGAGIAVMTSSLAKNTELNFVLLGFCSPDTVEGLVKDQTVPPHKHDVHNPPGEVDLEEIYYYRIDRPEGYAIQKVYTQDRRLDATLTVRSGELVLIPEGYHPVVAAHGYNVYYLNALAGSARSMAASDDPDYAWVRQTWTSRDPRLPLVN